MKRAQEDSYDVHKNLTLTQKAEHMVSKWKKKKKKALFWSKKKETTAQKKKEKETHKSVCFGRLLFYLLIDFPLV